MKDSLTSCLKTTELDKQALTIKIAFLDVGQGDTIVISSPETQEAIVVDCIDANSVLEYLEQEKIAYLRGTILTHLHDDHYSEADDLLNRCQLVPNIRECEKLAFRAINKKHYDMLDQDADRHHEREGLLSREDVEKAKRSRKVTLQNMLSWCSEDVRRLFEPYVQNVLQEDSLEEIVPMPLSLKIQGTLAKNIQLLYPYTIDLYRWGPKGLNNTSVAFRVLGPSSSALLTGDLEPEGWRVLQARYPDLHSDILKFPHHGGAWNESNTKALLDAVQPSVVVISVGTVGEKYSHPNKEVFDVLSSPSYSHIRVLCTQATKQCQATISDQERSVIQCLDQQAGDNGLKRIGSKRGCPCAGTIIVELGEQARVVQPTTVFHQEKIIRPHFRTHKCILV